MSLLSLLLRWTVVVALVWLAVYGPVLVSIYWLTSNGALK